MKHCLLLLGVVALLAVGAPAYSQYIFMDVDANGVCNTDDVLSDTVTSVDIYLDTNHNAVGGVITCGDGVSALDMFGYSVILHGSGAGSVSYTGWTNNMTYGGTWAPLEAYRVSGSDASLSYIAPAGAAPAGLYKIGSIGVSVSGTPTLSFLLDNSTLGGGTPITGFGSDCSGSSAAFTQVLGIDFTDACGTSSGTDASPTTWGTIKNLYR